MDALERIPAIAQEFEELTGHASGGLVRSYRTEDADTIVVALGSVLGTIKDAVDVRRQAGERVGVVGITSFRPFPGEAVREALSGASRIIVLEKAFSIGFGGVLATDVALVVQGSNAKVFSVVAGLGGRAITRRSLEDLLAQSVRGELNPLTFLDLDQAAVDRERARMASTRRSGPSAENLLRDLGSDYAASKAQT
jgi:pyruvate ferredoxin oxidoreductase alpha subunit